MIREALYDTVIGAGLACMDEVLEMERVALCGERYEHWADSQALRAGRVASSLVMGRRRVALQRPRAPTVDGHELARENQRKAGVQNVEFLKGEIENIPLPDSSVDVIISNCVINLSADKDRVLAESLRVLRPGGRFAVSDVVVRGELPGDIRRRLELWAGCIAGALEEAEYRSKLAVAGFEQIDVEPTRSYPASDAKEFLGDNPEAKRIAKMADGKFMSAFVRARKPSD
jgi:arsenite methyltransferase